MIKVIGGDASTELSEARQSLLQRVPRVEGVPSLGCRDQGRSTILGTSTPPQAHSCAAKPQTSRAGEDMEVTAIPGPRPQPGNPRAWGHCDQGGNTGAIA